MTILISFLVGLALPLLMGATTDQIWQNVYDSANTAIRVNLVSGGSGGTVTSTGTTGNVAAFTSSTNIGNYGGTGTSAGNVIASLDASGAATFVTAGSSNITNVSGGVFVIPNKSSTGTTVNKLVKLDTSASPATAVIAGTSDVNAVLGVCVSGCGTTGSATVLTQGSAKCQFDGTATVGHYAIVSTGTTGDCADSGSSTTYPTGVMVLGIVAESGTNASTRTVDFNTPDVASASSGPNGKGNTVQVGGTNAKITANFNNSTPAAASNNTNVTWQSSDSGNTTSISAQIDTTSFGKLSYNGVLGIKDIHADNASFTIANRIHSVTTGASAIAATTPASPTVGDTYTLIKIDSGAGTVVWTRAGSQTLNGATSRTISAQYGVDTCTYIASNVWVCQGSGT